MYIESVPNRKSPPCILLRETYRQDGKVRKRTVCNLTNWPPHVVESLREVLRGGSAAGPLEESFDVVRSRPHGHVAAALGTLRRLGLERLSGLNCFSRATTTRFPAFGQANRASLPLPRLNAQMRRSEKPAQSERTTA